MKQRPRLPRARTEGLIKERLEDELLIYDLERHQAHCLNRTAALVLERCDGRTGASQIARQIQHQLTAADGEKLVWLTLEQLAAKHLLQEPFCYPGAEPGISRRALIQTLGLTAAAALPVIRTLVAPEPIEAVTCKISGESCSSSGECCSGLCAGGFCA